VTELLPNDTQPPTDTDHQVLPSLSDPNNIRRTMNEALNKYFYGLRRPRGLKDQKGCRGPVP